MQTTKMLALVALSLSPVYSQACQSIDECVKHLPSLVFYSCQISMVVTSDEDGLLSEIKEKQVEMKFYRDNLYYKATDFFGFSQDFPPAKDVEFHSEGTISFSLYSSYIHPLYKTGEKIQYKGQYNSSDIGKEKIEFKISHYNGQLQKGNIKELSADCTKTGSKN